MGHGKSWKMTLEYKMNKLVFCCCCCVVVVRFIVGKKQNQGSFQQFSIKWPTLGHRKLKIIEKVVESCRISNAERIMNPVWAGKLCECRLCLHDIL